MNDTLNTINDFDTLEITHSFECDVTDLNKYFNVKKSDLLSSHKTSEVYAAILTIFYLTFLVLALMQMW